MNFRARLLACAIFTVPTFATAQDASETEATGEEIIVTAQKIEQRAVDVPITISATTGERLRELGVSDLDELSNYVPGLNIQEQSANNPGIVIRGITSDSGSAQEGARVTLYYNGVDISRSRGSYQDIYDVERIEVIKGPQATLFGTASAVGAISIISARPREGFSGELTAGYGNFDQKLLTGHLNAGNDRIAGRLAFAYKKRDGYVENLAPGQRDLNGQDQLGVRGSLRFDIGEDITTDIILTYDRQRNPGTAFVSGNFATPAGPADPFGAAFLGGSPISATALGKVRLGLDRDVYDANLTMGYDIGDGFTLTQVSGYREFDSLETFDADGSAAPYLEFAEEAVGWQASHETRFTYTSDSFRGAFGFNVFHEQGRQTVPFATEEGVYIVCTPSPAFNAFRTAAGNPGCVAPDGTVAAAVATGRITGGAFTAIPYQSVFENNGNNDSYSVFADATWIATPRLELTAGIRALIEERKSGYSATQPNSTILGLVGVRSGLLPFAGTGGQRFTSSDSFRAFLPRVNILYKIDDDASFFATVSKGRRSPTVQLSATATAAGPVPNLRRIAEENVWNYEFGLKGAVGPLSGSLGVYYQTYDNFQVSRVVGGQAITESAGSASNFGVEAEANLRLADWISAFANIGYIDGGIDNKAANGVFAGDRFRLQPEVQAAGGFTIDAELGRVRLFATPSITYRGRIFFEVPNNPVTSQRAVTLVNLRAGVAFADDRFEIAGFARNLTNKDYLLDAGNTGGAFGFPTFIPAEPRLYGVQLTGRF